MSRVTIVLYSQSNTLLYGGPPFRVDKAEQKAYVNPLPRGRQ
jgi:hypothetical protein